MSVEKYNASEAKKGKHTLNDIERGYQTLLWQQMEREADEDIKAGRFKTYRTKEALQCALDKLKR